MKARLLFIIAAIMLLFGCKKDKDLNEKTNLSLTVNGVSFEMVYVEGGSFDMGATTEQGGDAKSDEYPVQSVTLSEY